VTDARSILVAAYEDVQAANLPDSLQAIALSKQIDLHAALSGLASTAHAGPVSRAATSTGNATTSHSAVPIDDPLSAIAARIEVARETVAEVYDVRDGVPSLIIPPGKLPSQVAAATKELALLVAGAHQATGGEWTALDPIREVCVDFKKYDQGNFAKTIKSMDSAFNFRKESERKQLVKLARPGWDQYASLVRRMGGEV
jgi:hypothetical protein